jgi:hypothetical protein
MQTHNQNKQDTPHGERHGIAYPIIHGTKTGIESMVQFNASLITSRVIAAFIFPRDKTHWIRASLPSSQKLLPVLGSNLRLIKLWHGM